MQGRLMIPGSEVRKTKHLRLQRPDQDTRSFVHFFSTILVGSHWSTSSQAYFLWTTMIWSLEAYHRLGCKNCNPSSADVGIASFWWGILLNSIWCKASYVYTNLSVIIIIHVYMWSVELELGYLKGEVDALVHTPGRSGREYPEEVHTKVPVIASFHDTMYASCICIYCTMHMRTCNDAYNHLLTFVNKWKSYQYRWSINIDSCDRNKGTTSLASFTTISLISGNLRDWRSEWNFTYVNFEISNQSTG